MNVTTAINQMNTQVRAQYQAKANELGISLEAHVAGLLNRELDSVEEIAAGAAYTADHYNGFVDGGR